MANSVRCKFTCVSARKYKGWGGHEFLHEYEFQAVTGESGGEENKKFWGSTPSGSLKVGAVASNLFEPGQDYYIDLTPLLH